MNRNNDKGQGSTSKQGGDLEAHYTYDATAVDSFGMHKDCLRHTIGPGTLTLNSGTHEYIYRAMGGLKGDFFDVEFIVNEDRKVLIRFRTSDFYLLGFRNSGGQWYAFKSKDKKKNEYDLKLGPKVNVQDMPFHGTYESLGGDPIDGSQLGTKDLLPALEFLAVGNTKDNNMLKKSLRNVIVLVCECVRLRNLAFHIIVRGEIDEWRGVHDWGQFSRAVIVAVPVLEDIHKGKKARGGVDIINPIDGKELRENRGIYTNLENAEVMVGLLRSPSARDD